MAAFAFIYFTVMLGFLLFPKLLLTYMKLNGTYKKFLKRQTSILIYIDSKCLDPKYQLNKFHLLFLDLEFWIRSSLLRYLSLADRPTVFYPLFFYGLYITIGPWFGGTLIYTGNALETEQSIRWGWFFLYGIYVASTWMPLLDTYLYCLFEIATSFMPLIYYLSFLVTPSRYLYSKLNSRLQYPIHQRIFIRILILCIVLYHGVNVFMIGIFYGIQCVLISPGKTWFWIWSCWTLWRWRWGPVTEIHGWRYSRRQKSPILIASSSSSSSLSSSAYESLKSYLFGKGEESKDGVGKEQQQQERQSLLTKHDETVRGKGENLGLGLANDDYTRRRKHNT